MKKKVLLVVLMMITMLVLAACNEGMIYSDLKITDTDGAGTKTIKVKILHDDAICEAGENKGTLPVGNNFALHLPKGTDPIVEKLELEKPLDDLTIVKTVDKDAKCDWITISYSFKDINEYNQKTKIMAQAFGRQIEDATIVVDGNNLTFAEHKDNLKKSIDWALSSIYNDEELFVPGTGNSMDKFCRIHGINITIGENTVTYDDCRDNFDSVPEYIEVTGEVETADPDKPEPTPTPEPTPDPTPGGPTPVPVPAPKSDWLQVEPYTGDYTIVVMPDTQYYADENPEVHDIICQWIADNAEKENIKFVIHTGDFTNWNSDREWIAASNSMSILDGIVPYAPLLGNHDYPGFFTASRDTSQFNKYFPIEKFENRPEFGGAFEAGKMDNVYYKFNAEGTDFLLLALEFAPRDETVEWASEIIANHPDHKAIVVTHTYLNHDGKRVGKNTLHTPNGYLIAKDPNETVNNGDDLWEKLVRKHENIYMVVSGHIPGSYDVITNVTEGDHGNKVLELLVDPQGFGNGGQGLILLMKFSDNNTKISFNYYSPYHDSYYKAKNQFVLDLTQIDEETPDPDETPSETPDERPGETPDPDKTPDPDETPDSTESPDPDETPDPSGSKDKDKDKPPKTGDTILLYGLILIASLMGVVLVRHRRMKLTK